MGSGEPEAEELIVKAQYFFPIEPDEEILRKVQNRLTQIMREEGFYTEDSPLPFVTVDRSMEFLKAPPPGEKSNLEKLKEVFGADTDSTPRERLTGDYYLDGLERLRDDLPFRVVFRFKTFQSEEIEGYDVFVESTPALLQKSRQLKLHPDYSYNVDNIVSTNKREITRILGRLELEPTKGPYTEAETLDSRLSEQSIEELEKHGYGRTAVQYIHEGDRSLQQNLLHAALSCYIQGIEWVILHYKITEDDEDLVKEQQENERGPVYFTDLVDEVSDEAIASQKTISKLESFNRAERRWVAHHKSGQLEKQDVENVRSTLLRLTEEIFKNSSSNSN